MPEITEEMTIRDVLPFVSPAQRINLQPWADELGIQLREFRIGHIKTYEELRLRTVSRAVVNAEVSTQLGLLESVGAGEETRKYYQPLRDPEELSPEERASLPERALKYIEKLEAKVEDLETRTYRTEDRLRKANWAK